MNKEQLGNIPDTAPRVIKEIKTFGDGGRHVTLPNQLGDIGDRVLVINIDNMTSEDQEESG